MNRNLIILIVVVIVIFLVIVAPLLPFVISGYGGISSKCDGIDWAYDPNHDNENIQYTITDTYQAIQPPVIAGVGWTGLRMELGQPQFKGTEQTYFNEIKEETSEGVLKRTWEVRIAYFDLGCVIRTNGGGSWAIEDVVFWIELAENDFNVFQNADEVKAYILEVVTTEPAEVSDLTLVEVMPSAGGYSFDMEAIGREPLPSWMTDSGYQEFLSDLEIVRIPITVIKAQPYNFIVRAEQQASFKMEVRALVFGFWEVLSPYDAWVPGDIWAGWFPWLDDLFQGFQLILGGILGLIITVAIVKIPVPPFAKVVILGVVWIGIFVVFGGVALFAG